MTKMKTDLYIHYLTNDADPFFTTDNLIKNRKRIFENIQHIFHEELSGEFSESCFIICYYPENKNVKPVVEHFCKDNNIIDDKFLRWGVSTISVPPATDPKSVVCYHLNKKLKKHLNEGLVKIIKKETNWKDLRMHEPHVIIVNNQEDWSSIDELHIVIQADETVFLDTRGLRNFNLKDKRFYINSITELSKNVKDILEKSGIWCWYKIPEGFSSFRFGDNNTIDKDDMILSNYIGAYPELLNEAKNAPIIKKPR